MRQPGGKATERHHSLPLLLETHIATHAVGHHRDEPAPISWLTMSISGKSLVSDAEEHRGLSGHRMARIVRQPVDAPPQGAPAGRIVAGSSRYPGTTLTLDRDGCRLRHADIVCGLLESLGTAGNLSTDAHLAALAIEHPAELHSTDVDFMRFPGLRWRNPLS